MTSNLLYTIRSPNLRNLSQVISAVENGDPSLDKDLNSLYPHTRDTIRIGITGPPGGGKSTLIDKLITEIRSDGKSVCCISVDPTSPFSGGAFLGDRIRMNQHTLDPNVFIRSMGSRGELGGLAKKTKQVADILAASGKDILLLETVGVGQIESEIIKQVDITLVVLMPEVGDGIQFMKAGPIEIGDLFVINKSDREGADYIARTLRYYFELNENEREFIPNILMTVATEGKGVHELYTESFTLIEKLTKSGTLNQRRKQRYLDQIKSLVKDDLVSKFWTQERENLLNNKLNDFHDQKISPYDAALSLMNSLSD